MAYNFFMANEVLLGLIALAVSFLFIFLMVKNIRHVQKLREEKNDS
jgi:hypothetical protein